MVSVGESSRCRPAGSWGVRLPAEDLDEGDPTAASACPALARSEAMALSLLSTSPPGAGVLRNDIGFVVSQGRKKGAKQKGCEFLKRSSSLMVTSLSEQSQKPCMI